ncbi:hypothetical protein D3C85_1822250 [compost metagenome]
MRVKNTGIRIMGPDFDTASYSVSPGSTQGYSQLASLVLDAGTKETRPLNAAYHPRIHA